MPSQKEFWDSIKDLETVEVQYPKAELTLGDYKKIVEKAESLLRQPRTIALAEQAYNEGYKDQDLTSVQLWHIAAALNKKKWLKSTSSKRMLQKVKAELKKLNQGRCSE